MSFNTAQTQTPGECPLSILKTCPRLNTPRTLPGISRRLMKSTLYTPSPNDVTKGRGVVANAIARIIFVKPLSLTLSIREWGSGTIAILNHEIPPFLIIKYRHSQSSFLWF